MSYPYWKEFKDGDKIYQPKESYYTDENGIEHLKFIPTEYIWNDYTLNIVDPKICSRNKKDVEDICNIINKIHSY